jgi:hypothetical protein
MFFETRARKRDPCRRLDARYGSRHFLVIGNPVTHYVTTITMKLDGIVRAHEFMHIERPPVLWEADTQDEVFIRLLGEMISFALQRSPDVSALTLNVANVVVDLHSTRHEMPAGEYLAVTVRGTGPGTPELVWRPNAPLTFGPFGDLDKAALKSRAVWVHSRNLGEEGSITAVFRRLPALPENASAPLLNSDE